MEDGPMDQLTRTHVGEPISRFDGGWDQWEAPGE